MTSLAFTRAQAERRVSGRIWSFDDRVLVCRYPVSTSMPIPLSVRSAGAMDLLTWTFCGLGKPSRATSGGDTTAHPVGLLVVAPRDRHAVAALREAGRITLETHFHDLDIACDVTDWQDSPDGRRALTRPEHAALCAAVLSAVTPESFAPLSALFPVIGPAIDDLPVAAASPDLTIGPDGASPYRLAHHGVPNYLMLRTNGDTSCARIASAHLRPGVRPQAELTLETLWGPAPSRRPERVVMVTASGFASARPVASEKGR